MVPASTLRRAIGSKAYFPALGRADPGLRSIPKDQPILVSVLDLDSILRLQLEAAGYRSGRTSIHTTHLVSYALGSKPQTYHTRQAA